MLRWSSSATICATGFSKGATRWASSSRSKAILTKWWAPPKLWGASSGNSLDNFVMIPIESYFKTYGNRNGIRIVAKARRSSN